MNTATRGPATENVTRDELPLRSPLATQLRGTLRWADDAVYPLAVAISVVIVFLGQLTEDLADSPPLQMMPPTVLIQRWSVVALVVYALVMWAVLDRTVKKALPQVRHAVKVDQKIFDGYVDRMRRPSLNLDLAILLGVALLNVILFVGLNADLVVDDPVTHQAAKLPADPVAAVIVIGGYVVVGWAFLRLVFYGARLARQLGQLSRQPLAINVFDTTDLLPFGNIALAVALAPAGVLVILLIGLGAPTNPVGWSVVAVATLVIVLALLLPLRGIHNQMSVAKDTALATVNERIGEVFTDVARQMPDDPEHIARLAAHSGTLIPLRKTIEEMTTWPFRDTVALGRAVLIASAPLIYTTLSELIRVFIIGPLSP